MYDNSLNSLIIALLPNSLALFYEEFPEGVVKDQRLLTGRTGKMKNTVLQQERN
jgi:hypothetical protein